MAPSRKRPDVNDKRPTVASLTPESKMSLWRSIAVGFTDMPLPKKLSIVAFPFIGYMGFRYVQDNNENQEYSLHHSDFFKGCLELVSTSSEVKDTYGDSIRLDPPLAGFGGFFAKIFGSHKIWIPFHGENSSSGYIRIVIERVPDRTKISTAVEELKSVVEHSPDTEKKKKEDATEENLSEEEIKSRETARQKAYLAELRELYPTLPAVFTPADLRIAQKLRILKAGSRIWDAQWTIKCLTIHESEWGGPLLVLYDPEGYLKGRIFDNRFLSFRRPSWMSSPSPTPPPAPSSTPSKESVPSG